MEREHPSDEEVEVEGWLVSPDNADIWLFNTYWLPHLQISTAEGFEDVLISPEQAICMQALGFHVYLPHPPSETEVIDGYYEGVEHLDEEIAHWFRENN